MEQLIFIAVFLLAALGDLLIRWLRKRTDQASRDETAILEDAVLEADEEEEGEREEWLERRPMERQPMERQPEPVVAELPPPPIRAPALEEIAARRPVARPAPSRAQPAPSRAQPPVPLPRRARTRHRIANPADARQAIVAMTILGRCRGCE